MTPTQTKRAIEIMQKHGQEGWRIEVNNFGFKPVENPNWNWEETYYRAVGPRKPVELKRGMEVKHVDGKVLLVVQGEDCCELIVCDLVHTWPGVNHRLTHYRWPNGDGTWLPIEGEPEIISMEGVE